MANYITIDGGTTNTRVFLVRNNEIVASEKFNIGAGKNIQDKAPFCKALKDAIIKLLKSAGLAESDVQVAIASGMITSEYGLCELAHLTLPASLDDFANSKKSMVFPEISAIPFVFIPGAKVVEDSFGACDMMRGEETEVFGLWSIYKDGAYLLPGSHSKLVTLENGCITSIKTMLTGEMIAALSSGTILKDAIDLSVEDYDKEYLLKGYELAEGLGINVALFKTRILKNLFGATKEQLLGYFLGVCLADEIKAVASSGTKKVIVGGKSVLKRALSDILSAKTDISVSVATDEQVESSTCRGAITIFEA